MNGTITLLLDVYGPKSKDRPSWEEGNSEFKDSLGYWGWDMPVPRQGEVIRMGRGSVVSYYSVKWVIWTPEDDAQDAVVHLTRIGGVT